MSLVERIRPHRQKANRMLLIMLGWLAVFLMCRILYTPFEDMSALDWLLTTHPQHNEYLFGWLLSKNLFFFSSLVSILPAVFGKYRFSLVTLIGFAVAVPLGELLGPYPPGVPYGHGHYGWAIWGGIFLFSIAAGILLEIFIKRKKA